MSPGCAADSKEELAILCWKKISLRCTKYFANGFASLTWSAWQAWPIPAEAVKMPATEAHLHRRKSQKAWKLDWNKTGPLDLCFHKWDTWWTAWKGICHPSRILRTQVSKNARISFCRCHLGMESKYWQSTKWPDRPKPTGRSFGQPGNWVGGLANCWTHWTFNLANGIHSFTAKKLFLHVPFLDIILRPAHLLYGRFEDAWTAQ